MLPRTSNLQISAEPKINLAASFSLADLSVLHPTVPSMSPESSSLGGYRSIFVFTRCLPLISISHLYISSLSSGVRVGIKIGLSKLWVSSEGQTPGYDPNGKLAGSADSGNSGGRSVASMARQSWQVVTSDALETKNS